MISFHKKYKYDTFNSMICNNVKIKPKGLYSSYILLCLMRIQTNINLKPEIKIKLQHLSIDRNMTMNKLVEEALNQVYFNKK